MKGFDEQKLCESENFLLLSADVFRYDFIICQLDLVGWLISLNKCS